jgi:hypothetical protein
LLAVANQLLELDEVLKIKFAVFKHLSAALNATSTYLIEV